MRFDLKVPYAEKDAAKKLGARWDAARKIWYVQNQADLAPFAKWSPTPHDTTAAAPAATTPARPAAKARPTTSEGIRIVGSRYAPQPRVCDCLPWDVCDKCRAMALAH